MPSVLLLVFSISLGIGLTFFVLLTRWGKEPLERVPAGSRFREGSRPRAGMTLAYTLAQRPECWLAIRSRNILSVKTALGLHNPKPCRLAEGLSSESDLFIAPPIDGWVIVVGSALPDPGHDVDACFRFIIELSRKLGQVQFYRASRVVNHHAWVRAKSGKIQRAYAWAGRTVWDQGGRTQAETDLKLKCYDYTCGPERDFFSAEDPLASNVERVPLLAARWSLDPGRLDATLLEREHGITGDLLRRY